MNIQNLRYVLEIAQRGSMTAAAKVLYLSQPRLSKILAETEQKYGVVIFKRENNGLTPTEAGRKFLKIARDIVEEAEGKEKLLYLVDQANSARVSATCLSFTCDVFLEYVRTWEKEDGFRFFYKETDGLTAIGDVSTGASELGVIHLHNGVLETAQREVDSKGLHLEKLSDTVPHLVVRVGHPLARLNRPIRAEDLYDQSFVIYPELDWMMKGGSSIHSQVERGMKNMDWSRVKKIVYVSSRGTFYNLVTQTNAVAVGAQAVNNQERVNQVMSLPFDPEFAAGFEEEMNGGVYAVYRPGQALSEPVDGFLQLLRQIHYE